MANPLVYSKNIVAFQAAVSDLTVDEQSDLLCDLMDIGCELISQNASASEIQPINDMYNHLIDLIGETNMSKPNRHISRSNTHAYP